MQQCTGYNVAEWLHPSPESQESRGTGNDQSIWPAASRERGMQMHSLWLLNAQGIAAPRRNIIILPLSKGHLFPLHKCGLIRLQPSWSF